MDKISPSTTVKQFRKKPNTIEAILFDGTNLETIREFVGTALLTVPLSLTEDEPVSVFLNTLVGKMKVVPGDVIIKGVKGQFYTCQSDVFEYSHEATEVFYPSKMDRAYAVAAAKSFRQQADNLLQQMKDHRQMMITRLDRNECNDHSEAIAQHTLSIRDLESCIMRQGMALKYVGNPDPYPESRNPESPVVEPTADGLKL